MIAITYTNRYSQVPNEYYPWNINLHNVRP